MTRYDIIMENGDFHPLAGVPQEVLDVARDELAKSLEYELGDRITLEDDVVESMAHAVLAAGYKASRTARQEGTGGWVPEADFSRKAVNRLRKQRPPGSAE